MKILRILISRNYSYIHFTCFVSSFLVKATLNHKDFLKIRRKCVWPFANFLLKFCFRWTGAKRRRFPIKRSINCIPYVKVLTGTRWWISFYKLSSFHCSNILIMVLMYRWIVTFDVDCLILLLNIQISFLRIK